MQPFGAGANKTGDNELPVPAIAPSGDANLAGGTTTPANTLSTRRVNDSAVTWREAKHVAVSGAVAGKYSI